MCPSSWQVAQNSSIKQLDRRQPGEGRAQMSSGWQKVLAASVFFGVKLCEISQPQSGEIRTVTLLCPELRSVPERKVFQGRRSSITQPIATHGEDSVSSAQEHNLSSPRAEVSAFQLPGARVSTCPQPGQWSKDKTACITPHSPKLLLRLEEKEKTTGRDSGLVTRQKKQL